MSEAIDATPEGLDEQPLVYFPDGDPAARIGLTMTFYFGAPGTLERRRALVDSATNEGDDRARPYAVV